MGDVINLRQARKAKQRGAREKQAAENRSRFGASKASKTAEALRRDRVKRELDGNRREKRGEE